MINTAFAKIIVYCDMCKLHREYSKTTGLYLKQDYIIVFCFQVIKLQAWEESFAKKTDDFRRLEQQNLRKMAMLSGLNFALWFSLPFIVSSSHQTIQLQFRSHVLFITLVSCTKLHILQFQLSPNIAISRHFIHQFNLLVILNR